MNIPGEVADFLERQNFVIVSSYDPGGKIHNSCKGIVRIERSGGRIYLLDLYLHRTYRNLRQDPTVSLTAVDEHSFTGYCLQGRAKILDRESVLPEIVREWEEKINARISQRLVRNIRGDKGHAGHPEAKLPQPRYLITMDVEQIDDLTPEHLKTEER
jgi:hypothetical protein